MRKVCDWVESAFLQVIIMKISFQSLTSSKHSINYSITFSNGQGVIMPVFQRNLGHFKTKRRSISTIVKEVKLSKLMHQYKELKLKKAETFKKPWQSWTIFEDNVPRKRKSKLVHQYSSTISKMKNLRQNLKFHILTEKKIQMKTLALKYVSNFLDIDSESDEVDLLPQKIQSLVKKRTSLKERKVKQESERQQRKSLLLHMERVVTSKRTAIYWCMRINSLLLRRVQIRWSTRTWFSSCLFHRD